MTRLLYFIFIKSLCDKRKSQCYTLIKAYIQILSHIRLSIKDGHQQPVGHQRDQIIYACIPDKTEESGRSRGGKVCLRLRHGMFSPVSGKGD